MSIVFLYKRIFDTRKGGPFHVFLIFFIGFLVLWTLVFFLAILFRCGEKFSNLWAPYIDFTARCSNGHALWIDEAFSISYFCLDVMVFFLPLPKVSELRAFAISYTSITTLTVLWVWCLHMTLRHRLLVALTFVIGAS